VKFKRGKRKTGGRKKGTPNKFTLVVKDLVLETLARLGGADGMERFANMKKPPRGLVEFYRMVARLIPGEVRAEISGPKGEPIEHDHTHKDELSLCQRLDQLTEAFENAARREAGEWPPADDQPADGEQPAEAPINRMNGL
jgi:hypothetical protein